MFKGLGTQGFGVKVWEQNVKIVFAHIFVKS